MIRQRDWSRFIFVGVLLLTILVYLPSLHGSFLFDDVPNLGEMNKYGDMHQWDNARKFITHGIAGPTGRPISLLTFVPQADAWFAHDALPFKVVNLVLHLLCGTLLYYVTILLLKAYGYEKNKAIWVALLSSSFWLIHPFFVSTVAYIIQRMAQLPLLFGLITMIGYFKSREQLAIKPVLAYILMTLSIGIGTLLATFSKENGALLPLLILVIEFCNPIREAKPIWQWRAVCLWLPSLTIAVILVRYVDFSPDPWINRNFNQIERLLTEGRVVTNYLVQLFIPRIEGYGLFQDGFLVSRSCLSPPTTLLSILFLLTLLISSFLARKKYPLYALAVLFFFAAHLMESTVIGLELYFEHRNYVAAIFLFLPLTAALYELAQRIKPSITILICLMILSFLAILTWQRSMLWSDNTRLMVYWAQENPGSARAQANYANLLMLSGQYDQANQVLIKAIQYHPNAALMIQLLQQKVRINEENQIDFQHIRQQLLKQRIEPDDILNLRNLVQMIASNSQLAQQYSDELVALLNELLKTNQSYQRYGMLPLTQFMQGQLYLAKGNINIAYQHYEAYAIQFQRISLAQIAISDLNHRGYPQLALKLLHKTEETYQHQIDSSQDNKIIMQKLRVDIQVNMQTDRLKDITHGERNRQ